MDEDERNPKKSLGDWFLDNAAKLYVSTLIICMVIGTFRGVAPDTPVPVPVEQEMMASGIPCPLCSVIPGEMTRFRTTVLLEGPAVVTPTPEYLTYLGGTCEMYTADSGCNEHFDYIRKTRENIESFVNPTYGRPRFSEDRLSLVRWMSHSVEKSIEQYVKRYVPTERDLYEKKRLKKRDA